MGLPGYQKIKTPGYRNNRDVFDGEVVVQEKIDGSQIGFGVKDGQLYVRSRGGLRDLDETGGLFGDAMQEGLVYYGECVTSPCHNHIEYERVPRGYVALWDVRHLDGQRTDPRALGQHADALDLEPVAMLYEGEFDGDPSDLIPDQSALGGVCEGVVVRNLDNGQIAKVLNDEFKEVHRNKSSNKNSGGLSAIIESYRTEARWRKARQHLAEAGELDGEPRDIGKLVKEVQRDVFDEDSEAIKDALLEIYKSKIGSGVVGGLAEWYKEELCNQANG